MKKELIKKLVEELKSEGSRGGKVIGHTKSGKPIYESHEQTHTQHYTSEDHSDAVNAHMKESKKHADDVKWYQKVEENTGNEVSDRRSAQDKQNEHKKKQDHHSSMAELHSNAMNSKLDKKSEKKD